jgi:hypothetical protein
LRNRCVRGVMQVKRDAQAHAAKENAWHDEQTALAAQVGALLTRNR